MYFRPKVARAPRQLISNVNARTSDEIKGEPSNAYMSLHYINYSPRARTWRSRWSAQRLPAPIWHWSKKQAVHACLVSCGLILNSSLPMVPGLLVILSEAFLTTARKRGKFRFLNDFLREEMADTSCRTIQIH